MANEGKKKMGFAYGKDEARRCSYDDALEKSPPLQTKGWRNGFEARLASVLRRHP